MDLTIFSKELTVFSIFKLQYPTGTYLSIQKEQEIDKKLLLGILPLLILSQLHAGKGKLRVSADQQGAYEPDNNFDF